MTNPRPWSSALVGAFIALAFLAPFIAADFIGWLVDNLTGSLLLSVATFFVSSIVLYAALFGWANDL